jgi:hypothetical protein
MHVEACGRAAETTCWHASASHVSLVPLCVYTCCCPVGDDFKPSNYINMAAVLFMWVVMPAFGAAAYVPSITLGELHLLLCVHGWKCQHK